MVASDRLWGDRKAKKRKSIFSEIGIHARRCAVIIFNTLCGNVLFYILVGAVNRLWPGRPIRSIFLFYAVNSAYLKTMIYEWYAPIVRWRPGLGQVIRHQGGFWSLSFGITAKEKDFYNSANEMRLAKLYKDVERIRKIVGAEQMTFSGELPGIFVRKGIMQEDKSPENKNTVKAVILAVQTVAERMGIPTTSPVIILGAKGFIGHNVTSLLTSQGREVYPIDTNNGSRFPFHLTGKTVIVLNITKGGILQEYISLLWDKAVVLNEVYPEPEEAEIEQLKTHGISCYHISGVSGSAMPGFPMAYSGAIPCCASYIEDDFKVVLKKLA